ncbi:MAG: HupE/UreJ family protein [Bryobacteraceae bacterium]
MLAFCLSMCLPRVYNRFTISGAPVTASVCAPTAGWKLFLLNALLFLVTPMQVASHPLHLTTVTVDIDSTQTRVTAAVHVAHLGRMPPERVIPHELRLRLDGVLFSPADTSVTFDETGQIVTWKGRESRSASRVALDAPLFPDSYGDSTVVLVYRNGRLVDRAVVTPGSPSATLAETAFEFSRRFVSMGIHHILSGFDHLLFVLGLLLLGGSLRGLLAVVTAFTVAHSITLSMTALGLGNLPARLVEPLIALSIVAVGAENLLHRKMDVERRVWLAFGFGFFHGFGFAGALAEIGLPRESIVWSLAAFNAGVEIGQAAIVLLAVPILRTMEHRNAVLATAVTRYASVGIVAAGILWFVERVRSSWG